MSMTIRVEFKDPKKESLNIPVTAYRTIWASIAKRLGLVWLPHFLSGGTMTVADLPAVIDEFCQMRAELIRNPPQSTWWRPVDVEWYIERADLILEKLTELDPAEIAEIDIG